VSLKNGPNGACGVIAVLALAMADSAIELTCRASSSAGGDRPRAES
jgi:hypothetical protein